MNKKGQAAIEFLMTYGWAILMVLIAIGALAYSGVITDFSIFAPEIGHLSRFNIIDHQFTGSDSQVPNNFYMILSSKIGDSLTINRLQIFKDEIYCGEVVGEDIIIADKVILVGGPLSIQCTNTMGKQYKYDLIATYSKQNGLNRTDKGFISGTFTPHNAYSVSEWVRTDFSGQSTTEEANSFIGSYQSACPGNPPSDTSSFTGVIGTIYWDLPQEGRCYSSQAANKGFSTAHCNINIPYLAHGWVAAQLEVSPLLEGHDFYLIGDAEYIDEDDQQKYDGICINDNLYFYVNNNLIGMGGTTGAMGNQDNQLDPGEEVIKGCNGCQDIDSSAWCIPPVKLTTAGSGFEYGETNTIMVLVEDFCFPTGSAHGGGLKPFRFYFVE